MYTFLVFVHLVGVFGFLLAHGVSAGVALRLRKTRETAQLKALLDLSNAALGLFYMSLFLLLAAGIAAAFVGHLWGRGWIWAAIGVLAAMMGAMYGLASPYYGKLREAAGIQSYAQKKRGIQPRPPAPPAELDAILARPQPVLIVYVGSAGLLVILWLMVLKPF